MAAGCTDGFRAGALWAGAGDAVAFFAGAFFTGAFFTGAFFSLGRVGLPTVRLVGMRPEPRVTPQAAVPP